MISKSEARKIVKEQRMFFPETEFINESRRLADIILESEYFTKASKVMCYASIRGEVDTFYLMEKVLESHKLLALPVTVGKEMIFYEVNSLQELSPGYMGIAEPRGEQVVVPDNDTLMIMPGVAFDKQCHRVGYGAGCYDRYLKKNLNCIKLAPAFDFQMFDEVENEEFDIRPDIVVLPDGKEYKI